MILNITGTFESRNGPVHLLRRIEVHLRRTGTPPTRFGREAVRDPRFVLDLRNGREPRSQTAHRVIAYLDKVEGARPL